MANYPTVHGRTQVQHLRTFVDSLNGGTNTPVDQAIVALFLQINAIVTQLQSDMAALRAALGAAYSQPAFAADTSQNPIP